jgi:hypothetical protein
LPEVGTPANRSLCVSPDFQSTDEVHLVDDNLHLQVSLIVTGEFGLPPQGAIDAASQASIASAQALLRQPE